jgi:hypothetical protein
MAKRSERTGLFHFTGNYYRSRFAEVLVNTMVGKTGLPSAMRQRIEIHGDQRERIVAELERLGYKVKRVGR